MTAFVSSLNDFIVYYKLDEASGNRSDSSANAVTLTDNNTVTSAAGIQGNGAVFTGSSSESLSASDPSCMTNGAAMSWSFWVKSTTFATQNGLIGKWNYQTNGEYAIQVDDVTATSLLIYIATSAADAGTGCKVRFASAFTNNTRSHIVILFDGSATGDANRLKAYRDGSALTAAQVFGNVPATIRNDTADFTLGRAFTGSLSRYLTGEMDEVGIWNRVITAGEIASLYNSGNGSTYVPPSSGSPYYAYAQQ